MTICLLLPTYSASAGAIPDGDGDKAEYVGNVAAYVNYTGLSINTTHGVIFPSCNIYAGGSAEYSFNWGYHFANIAADGRWFYPRSGKVQGYVGLEAGISVRLWDLS